jgi:hypothetical protein
MQKRITGSDEHFDRTTSASICNAIGARLQALLDEMQRQDRANAV